MRAESTITDGEVTTLMASTTPCIRRRSTFGVAAAAAVLLALLAGCVATPDGQRPDRASRATTSTTDVSFGEEATGTASAGNGASVTLGVSLGDIYRADEIPEAHACAINVSGGLDSAVAIPIRVTARLTSSSPTDVTVHLGNVSGLATGGNITLAGAHYWALKYSSTPQECQGSGSGAFPATVKFAGMSPQSADDWTAWLVVPRAVTGGDPEGRKAAGALVLSPLVVLAGQTASPAWTQGQGNVVSCSASDPAAGNANYVAIDTDEAQAHGCDAVAPTPNEQARSRACLQANPGGAQQTVDGMLVHNRASSLAMVCDGFAAPQGVEWTTGMTCFVIAALQEATHAMAAVDNLCSASDVIEQYTNGTWIRGTAEVGCTFLGAVFMKEVEVIAETMRTATPIVGQAAAFAMGQAADLACDAFFGGSSSKTSQLGQWLEANHEAHVASDITHQGLCLAVGNGDVKAVTCRN